MGETVSAEVAAQFFETTATADRTATTGVGAPTLTFVDVNRAIGGLGGEPRTGARFAIYNAVMRALNSSGAESFVEAFRFFEAERSNWQRELAEAPPRVAPGAHVFDMPEGADESELRGRPAGQSTSRRTATAADSAQTPLLVTARTRAETAEGARRCPTADDATCTRLGT